MCSCLGCVRMQYQAGTLAKGAASEPLTRNLPEAGDALPETGLECCPIFSAVRLTTGNVTNHRGLKSRNLLLNGIRNLPGPPDDRIAGQLTPRFKVGDGRMEDRRA